jgi:dGTPase
MLTANALASASVSALSATSKGRLFQEHESLSRTAYARDRDRIIHCTAFRRLKGKTQVFVAHSGDYFRTRLTHTLEVAQIARAMAYRMKIDQDLTESIALAHDLGHPPFGHAGEDELDKLMQPWGGFDHNVQSFRIVTALEVRYPSFVGLNLTYETLEGIIKHNGPIGHKLTNPAWLPIAQFDAGWPLGTTTYATIEAQVAALADDIAYNNHDIDDGLQAQLFKLSDLEDVALIGQAINSVHKDWPDLDARMTRLEAIRRLIGIMVEDVLRETYQRLETHAIDSPDAVRHMGQKLVDFSDQMTKDVTSLRAFLHESMYKHHSLNRTRAYAKRVLSDMFSLFAAEPNVLEPHWFKRFETLTTDTQRMRLICDYIAGMTDAYALSEHKKLFP